MDISRRHFLLGSAGAAAGLILPSYYRRALEFIDRTGQPLLEEVARPSTVLTAYPAQYGDLKYQLAVGSPWEGPPPMTLREFAGRYDADVEEWYCDYGDAIPWDEPVDWGSETFFETWMYEEAPQKLAYELLSRIDLGPQLGGKNAVGELKVEEGWSMVSAYWEVAAADDITLSLLQERLSALNTGVKVVMLS